MENRHSYQPTSPLPIWEGQGIGPTYTPINRHNQGEVLTPHIEKSVFISYSLMHIAQFTILLRGKCYNIFILHHLEFPCLSSCA